jgi:hypothetical protein
VAGARCWRRRASAFAVCAALLAGAPRVGAQELTGRVRVLGGYLTEAYPRPQPRLHDIFAIATPEVTLFWGTQEDRRNLTYSLTGALHTQGGMSELAHRLALTTTTRLGRRTVFNFAIGGAQSTLSNLLISTPFATGVGTVPRGTLLPSSSYRLLGGNVSESLQHELSPVWLATQTAQIDTFTTLEPTPPLDTLAGGLGVALERVFPTDALGVGLGVGSIHTRSQVPNGDFDLVFANAGPRWRRDWSPTISTLIAPGVAVLFHPLVPYPAANASLLYTPAGSAAASSDARAAQRTRAIALSQGSVELAASTGIVPSPLTGQLTRSHMVTLVGRAPIFLPARVMGRASVGVMRSELLDPTSLTATLAFSALSTSVDVTWDVTNMLQLFGSYQFIGQVGDTTVIGVSPSFLRDMVMVGIQISTRPPDADNVSTRLPQRVDQSDVPSPVNASDSSPEPDPLDRRGAGGVDDGSATRMLPDLPLETPRITPRSFDAPRDPIR